MATLEVVWDFKTSLVAAAGRNITLVTHDSASRDGTGLILPAAEHAGADAATPADTKTALASTPVTMVIGFGATPVTSAFWAVLAGISTSQDVGGPYAFALAINGSGQAVVSVNDVESGPQNYGTGGYDLTALGAGDILFIQYGGAVSIRGHLNDGSTEVFDYGGSVGSTIVYDSDSRISGGMADFDESLFGDAGAQLIEFVAFYASALTQGERDAIYADPTTMWGGGGGGIPVAVARQQHSFDERVVKASRPRFRRRGGLFVPEYSDYKVAA